MRQISIDEALKRGKLLLVWIPIIIMFCCFGLAIAMSIVSKEDTYLLGVAAGLIISGFIAPWIWWSFQVVKWKIWAFTNVADIKSLEKRAIAAQLIWSRGNWFEKTEIKSRKEKLILADVYKKLETATSKREKVYDNSLPAQFVIKYPMTNIFIYAACMTIGFYLIYVDRLFLGIATIIGCGYLAVDLFRKISKKQFLMKLDQHGVTLNHVFLPWGVIDEYYIEKSGFGSSTSFSIIIQGQDIYENISMSDVNTNAFTVEKYMDVYRTRFELRNGIN